MQSRKSLNAVDLFCGAGGFSLSAIRSGFNIKFAIDSDPHSTDTYRRNICQLPGNKRTEVYAKDILRCDPMEFKTRHFKNQACDLVLGGPPCQGFSTHRILDSGVRDPRNKLIYSYFDFVRILRPTVFLMENVPGILWDRHKPYLQRFYREGKAAGYLLQNPIVLDARDYGVPQRRKRVFVLGIRNDIDLNNLEWPPSPSHTGHSSDASVLPKWLACRSVFKNYPKNDPNSQRMKNSPEIVETFKNTPKNGGSRADSGRILPCHVDHDGHKDVYGRIDPKFPAPTMTTACINPSKGRFVHPTRNSGITVREAARIQTFPDDFIFSGGLMSAGQQVGNAVPIEMGVALMKSIKKFVRSQHAAPSKLNKNVA